MKQEYIKESTLTNGDFIMDDIYLYAARDSTTGKLVSDITNPKRKYWDRRGNAESAIEAYNRNFANKPIKPFDNRGEHGIIELVVFKLVEVK